MKKKLVSDKTWNLEGKNIQDLGLFPHDVDRLKKPIWLPSPTKKLDQDAAFPKGKTAMENISKGHNMPVDVAPPRAMMGAAALAITAGFALLSQELLAEQARSAQADGDSFDGGFG